MRRYRAWVRALVAFDGSEEAQRALDRVIDIRPSVAVVLGVGPDQLARKSRRRRGRPFSERPGWSNVEELDRAVEHLRNAGVAAEPLGKSGDVVKTILETAANGNFDLIVLGTRKRSALARFLFGSKSERVVRKATVSVLVVR